MNDSNRFPDVSTDSGTPNNLLTADEVALRLKVTRRALSNWPWLPRIKIGRSVRYIWSDILETLRRRG